jgi:DNA-nicking Smr family endonuclease
MNEKNNEPKKISDADLFRLAVGDVQPIKKNKTVRIKQPTLSILQNPQAKPTSTVKNNSSQHIPAKQKTTPSPQPSHQKITLTNLLESVTDSEGGYRNRLIANLEHIQFNRRDSRCCLYRNLRKGLLPIEDEIDLHHYTVKEAKHKTLSAILSAYYEGFQCIRIIHGKGLNSQEGNASPIKYAVNHWLRQVPIVRGFCSCVPKDGGTGAIYVLIEDK